MKTFEERYEKKIKTYDTEGGFIIYVEGYDNQDLDVGLILEFFKEELKKEHERGFIEGADLTGRLADENKSGEIEKKVKKELKRITDLIKDKKSEHNDWCESLENKDMPCDCGVAEYNLGLKESINIIKNNLT